MGFLLAIGAAVLLVGMSQRNVAQAGGNTPEARRRAALRRLPPHLRAQAERKARASGMSRGVRGMPKALRARAPVISPPLPWFPEDVDEVMLALLDRGQRDPEALTLRTLREVYPVTHEGAPIGWPAIPADSAAIRALEERVRIRAQRHLSALADIEAEELYHD